MKLGDAAREFGYNPDEPRERGRWTGGGGAIRKALKTLSPKEAKAKGHLNPDGSAPYSGGAGKSFPDRVSTDENGTIHYEYDDGYSPDRHSHQHGGWDD